MTEHFYMRRQELLGDRQRKNWPHVGMQLRAQELQILSQMERLRRAAERLEQAMRKWS